MPASTSPPADLPLPEASQSRPSRPRQAASSGADLPGRASTGAQASTRARNAPGLPILRAWLAFAALGSGIVHLALAYTSIPAIAITLAALGVAELAWGVVAIVLDRLTLPRTARLAAIAPVAGWGLLTVAAGLFDNPAIASSLRFLPMAVTALFDLAIAMGLSVVLRRASQHPETSRPEPVGGGRYLIGLTAGALVVSLLAAPALTAAQGAGTEAPPTPAGGVISHKHGGH